MKSDRSKATAKRQDDVRVVIRDGKVLMKNGKVCVMRKKRSVTKPPKLR